MKPETLKHLIDEYQKSNPTDGLAAYIIEVLQLEVDIVNAMRNLVSEQVEEKKRRDIYLTTIQSRLAEIQEKCPHWEYEYHGDPSGGSDSYHECCFCQKQW